MFVKKLFLMSLLCITSQSIQANELPCTVGKITFFSTGVVSALSLAYSVGLILWHTPQSPGVAGNAPDAEVNAAANSQLVQAQLERYKNATLAAAFGGAAFLLSFVGLALTEAYLCP